MARAIDARGGPLESYRREIDAHVVSRILGDWSWEIAYRYPESFRWTIETWGEQQSVEFDGRVAQHRLGGSPLPPSPAAVPAARSQARWLAVTALDVLVRDAGVEWQELPRTELPSGAAAGVRAVYRDDGSAYELFFDEDDLLVRARGTVDLAPVGSGRFVAVFGDFRAIEGYRLPYGGDYSLEGKPLFHERVRAWFPNQF